MESENTFRKKLKKAWKTPWVVPLSVALVVGFIVCLEVRSFLSKEEPNIDEPRYLVARQDLPAGQPVHFLDFTIAQHSTFQEVPTGAITDQEWHLLEGRALRKALAKGAVLTQEAVSSGGKRLGKSVPKGYRAYSFMPSNSVRVLPGDRVDVLVNPENRSQASVIILENLSVLQVDNTDDAVNIVAAMTGPQIQLLEKARRTGKLTVALRNPEEMSVERALPRKRVFSGKRNPNSVQVVSEGEL